MKYCAILIRAISFISAAMIFLVPLCLYQIIPDSFELPHGDLKGIAVDSDGNIYCGAQFYGRYQVYDSEGKFLYGKFLGNGVRGPFRMKINNDDQLEVITSSGMFYIFDKAGNIVKKNKNTSNLYNEFGTQGERYIHDEKRDVEYIIRLRHSYLCGYEITKYDSSNEEAVIIKTPFPKCLVMGFFQDLILISISMILSFIFDSKFRHKWKYKISKIEKQMGRFKLE